MFEPIAEEANAQTVRVDVEMISCGRLSEDVSVRQPLYEVPR